MAALGIGLVLLFTSAVQGAAPDVSGVSGWKNPLLNGAVLQVPFQLAAFPLDTFKTRLQIPFGAPGAYQASEKAFAVRRVNARQPPFWSGVGASSLSQLPTFFLVYSTFEAVRNKLEKKFPEANKVAIDVGASMVGSLVGSVWSTPCEVVKCTFQSGMYTASLKSAVRAIQKEAGMRGFFQGYTSQLCRDLPFYSIMFATYEAMHDTYRSKFLTSKDKKGRVVKVDDTQDLANVAIGFCAGAFSGLITNPLDVARTQATMRTWSGGPSSNSLGLLPRILAEQGVRGLFAGALVRSTYIGLGAGAFFYAYERTMKQLQSQV